MSVSAAYIVSCLVSSHWQHSVEAMESSVKEHGNTTRSDLQKTYRSSSVNMLLCRRLYGCNSYMTCLRPAVAIPLKPSAEELAWQLPAARALLHGTLHAM